MTPMAEPRDAALNTYRYLRGGMAALLLMLGTAVAAERLRSGCWQTSISAYYFTPAQTVFVGSLCALGALLIVYRGSSDTEDVLLNLAGTLAFIVAFVPTSRPVLTCGDTVAPSAAGPSATVGAWAVVVALLAARLASWWLYRRTETGWPRSALGTVVTWAQRAVFTVGVVTLAVAPEWFVGHAHGIAAVVLFAAIITTVVQTAFVVGNQDDDRCPHRGRYRAVYRTIAATMAATLLTAVVLHLTVDGFNHAVLVVEAALIAAFGVYWVVQTVELWGTTTREPLLAAGAAERSRTLRAL